MNHAPAAPESPANGSHPGDNLFTVIAKVINLNNNSNRLNKKVNNLEYLNKNRRRVTKIPARHRRRAAQPAARRLRTAFWPERL